MSERRPTTGLARNIVNQILDEAGTDVATRQRINDVCDQFVVRLLDIHADRIRAEALAPVLALADECERLDAYLSHDVTDLTSPMGWRGVNRPAWEVIRTAAALRAAAGTPTHHTTEEDR